MITVNSLSGGKTSSYISMNYPADLEVFALVCIDDINANANTAFKVDAKIRQMVNDKLQKYCPHMPEFLSTAEDPLTIKTMFDLEQLIGREIVWVRGIGYDSLIREYNYIPNAMASKCTTLTKIDPIFKLLYMHFELPCRMRIGYRADETSRVEDFTENYKMPIYSQMYNKPKHGGMGFTEWFSRFFDFQYRVGEFPLVKDDVFNLDVQNFWIPFIEAGLIEFPPDTNCTFCFHKKLQQIKVNSLRNPSLAMWAAVMEEIQGNTFQKKWSMLETQNVNIQSDLFENVHSSCKGGYCLS
jgi:hypothetical protein